MSQTRTETRPVTADLTRVAGDVLAVIRGAHPTSARRWVTRMIASAPEIVRDRSLRPADLTWRRTGARFRTPSGRSVFLPGDFTPGAREMYCRNVYLRDGLVLPAGGWVVDLGANAGLFTLMAAVEGARVVAVEAQQGFAAEIARLLAVNRIEPARVHIEVALAAAARSHLPLIGVVANDERWRTATHAATSRPRQLSMPELMAKYAIDRVALLKMDVEGSEFSVLHPQSDLSWLKRVDQLAMEIHPAFGDFSQVHHHLVSEGFSVRVTDNDGRRVPPASPLAAYAYCTRGRHA